MKDLEQYFRDALKNPLGIDHGVRARIDEKGDVIIYIHPANVSGDTLDFKVAGNTLEALR